MREDICSIPINDIFGPKDGCPFCRMRDMLEDRMATYITGAAMMEPDVRVETNRLGFCKTHFDQILQRGSRLSAGQRQLISFARALLADPKILILDEATSSIDTETEILLQRGLLELLKGRTSFIIAHRLSTIKNSDCIMYIDNGNILEKGSHEELMAKQGEYYQLYMSQYAFLENN